MTDFYKALVLSLLLMLSFPASSNCQDSVASEGRREAAVSPFIAADNLTARAFALACDIFKDARRVRYEHNQVPAGQQIIKNDDGSYDVITDCSGFISYLVHTVSQPHYRVVRERQPEHPYPQAKTWARFFDSLIEQPQNGWHCITDYRNLKPGDIIAWLKAPDAEDHEKNNNTGHIMMVAESPAQAVQDGALRYVSVRVIDSSTTYHFTPEELPPNAHLEHRNGLGIGYVRVYLSKNDEPIGYWAGPYWGGGDVQVTAPKFSRVVRFGRMVPIRDN